MAFYIPKYYSYAFIYELYSNIKYRVSYKNAGKLLNIKQRFIAG